MDVYLPNYAVYWAPSGETDSYGRVLYEIPVEIECRWEDRSELFVNASGEQETSAGKVFVNGDEETGGTPLHFLGLLRKGTLDQLVNLEEPFKNTNVWEIRQIVVIPDLDDSYQLVTVYVGAQRGPGTGRDSLNHT